VNTIRRVAVARSGLIATLTFVPVLATILTFITYALSGHALRAATVFSSLQLFNVIRFPLMLFPIVFSSSSDALVALERIGRFLAAEEGGESYTLDPRAENAAHVDADFSWEVPVKVTNMCSALTCKC
jgi:ATP-binding cassette, subfamily C (CFTR/MRP), member 1